MSKEETKLSMSINGHSKVPPGFRFHPTEEELLHYYLRKKVAYEKIDLDVIQEVDLNKLEPWDIQNRCNIGSTPQNEWYFFSHKDKKYPTGTRTNRATAAGFWKATGRDKVIQSSLRRIGMRKTLVFYTGRAPHGHKSDWIMHEYRLDDNIIIPTQCCSGSSLCDYAHEEGWVICRVFKKKNYHKSLDSPPTLMLSSSSIDTKANESININEGDLDHLHSTRRSNCKQETESNFTNISHNLPVQLPRLEDTTTSLLANSNQGSINLTTYFNSMNELLRTRKNLDTNVVDEEDDDDCMISNWSDLDKFVASQLNGTRVEESNNNLLSCCYDNDKLCFSSYDEGDLSAATLNTSEGDIWSYGRPALSSSLDPLCHLSV